MNPVASLFKSRKFLLTLLDLVVSLSAYFITKYASVDASKDVLFLIGAIQPVFVTMIYSIAVEDAAEKGNEKLAAGYVAESLAAGEQLPEKSRG